MPRGMSPESRKSASRVYRIDASGRRKSVGPWPATRGSLTWPVNAGGTSIKKVCPAAMPGITALHDLHVALGRPHHDARTPTHHIAITHEQRRHPCTWSTEVAHPEDACGRAGESNDGRWRAAEGGREGVRRGGVEKYHSNDYDQLVI